MAKSLALNILAVSGMVLGDGTNSRLGRVMGQTRQGEMECRVLQGLKGCCCPAVPSSGTVPRGWGQLFKEFLLNEEFYNPNYVSLLSYQFPLSTKTVVIF